jgi:uncharacterized protein YecE (DUF72 family)
MEIRVGCAGWSYQDWVGPFYPRGLNGSEWLRFYSTHFDIMEINTTFYQLPPLQLVQSWYSVVPESFSFIAKVWQEITHSFSAPDISDKIETFIAHMVPLKEKLKGFLFQFPPNFRFTTSHVQKIERILSGFPARYPKYLELRDDSWIGDLDNTIKQDLHEIVQKNENTFIVTGFLEGYTPIFPKHQSKYYIRLIGDRKLSKFNARQREQRDINNQFWNIVESIKRKPDVDSLIIIVNNHYRGFAPQDVNEILQKLGKPVKNIGKQHTLDAFFDKKDR